MTPATIELTGDESLRLAPPVAWAIGRVREAARDRGPSGVRVSLASAGAGEPESYRMSISRDQGVAVAIEAADPVGASYALTELAARIAAAASVDELEPGVDEGSPAVPVRGIMRSFSSVHEDSSWFHDREFWTDYLDHLAAQRFNRFHLAFGMQYNYGADRQGGSDNYLCFVYPFLFEVDGYPGVRAEGVSAEERARNLDALQFIARETVRRGMRFQLGLWNHAYDYGRTSKHWYPILGIGAETHAAYSAAGLARLLREVPEVSGVSFRVHYEGGIHDDGHEVFWDALFGAISEAGRPIEVDMHAKGVDQALLDAVDKPNLDPVLSGKYWAEHMGLPYHQTSIREREYAQPMKPGHEMNGITEFTRRFTRYGYGDFLGEDRTVDFMFRVWPGTQKLLLWGDPAIAAGYGRYATFGGSRGVDFCEPLYFKGRKGSGRPRQRDPYVRDDLALTGREWEKYRYTYLLWGRLLYDPDASPEVWRRFLRAEYGAGADAAERALAALGRILPLQTVVHGVGGSNNGYWPEVAVNLPVSSWVHSDHYEFDTPDPKNWGGVSPFDPTMFYGIDEYVRDAVAGELGPRHTPLEVAAWMDGFTDEGESALAELRERADDDDPQVQRTLIDLELLVGLGRFYAERYRTAVDYAVWERTGDGDAMRSALDRHQRGRDIWAGIAERATGVYAPDMTFGVEEAEHGHWAMRLPAMDADLRALRLEASRAPAGNGAGAAVRHRDGRVKPDGVTHEQPARYGRGEPVTLALATPPEVEAAVLHYRHVDQSERFHQVDMTHDDHGFVATIPGEYTASRFALMYFFELRTADQPPTVHPGFGPTISNQPYYALHSSAYARSRE